MNPGGDGVPRLRQLLQPREFQQVVVCRALLVIAEDIVGADDLPEFQRGFGIVRSDVGMGAFDGSSKRGPESFGVIVWESPEQIVQRIHRRSRCWFRLRPKFPPRIYSGVRIQTKTLLPVDNVDPVRRKNDLRPTPNLRRIAHRRFVEASLSSGLGLATIGRGLWRKQGVNLTRVLLAL